MKNNSRKSRPCMFGSRQKEAAGLAGASIMLLRGFILPVEKQLSTVEQSVYLVEKEPIFLRKKPPSTEDFLGRVVMVNNLNFYCLIRSYFNTNGAEAPVFVSMLSRRNIRSWTGARLFSSLIAPREVTDKNRLP